MVHSAILLIFDETRGEMKGGKEASSQNVRWCPFHPPSYRTSLHIHASEQETGRSHWCRFICLRPWKLEPGLTKMGFRF